MASIPLDGGGFVLVEAPATLTGPVKAGRAGDAVHSMSRSLQQALEPVTEAARGTLEQLRTAFPDEITVEFGVDLAVEAGAVITKTGANAHLRVTVRWRGNGSHHLPAAESTD
ncbi:hypothetical protein OG756_30430 [Streptomyces sp. NBC_01310]|uniref:CU044_2847 family protein n=1 Tax=Streptomyces sp. NBC_01310 TaxID=2903820 RepID=UPI0035B5FF55|nr:hypothetical protein OG756_30430 [Streptomyces sp. NBC_01310]